MLTGAGWSIAIACAVMCAGAALQTPDVGSIAWWTAALLSIMGGLANHTFCRLCQHVQEIRDEMKSR